MHGARVGRVFVSDIRLGWRVMTLGGVVAGFIGVTSIASAVPPSAGGPGSEQSTSGEAISDNRDGDEGRVAGDRATDHVQQLYMDGVALYKDRKYSQAIKKFEAAYEGYPDPQLLYNIGRCYEGLGDHAAATSNYRRCRAHPKSNAALKSKSQSRIDMLATAKMRSALAQKKRVESGAGDVTATEVPAESNLTFLNVGKWVTGAVGVGLLVGGGVLMALRAGDLADIDDARTTGGAPGGLTRTEAVALKDSADSKRTLGLALLGAGAAVTVGSIVMFALDMGEREPADGSDSSASTSAASTRVSFSPLLEGGGAMFVSGRF